MKNKILFSDIVFISDNFNSMKLPENRRPTAKAVDPSAWTATTGSGNYRRAARRLPAFRWSEKVDRGTKSLVFWNRMGIRYRPTNPRLFEKMGPSVVSPTRSYNGPKSRVRTCTCLLAPATSACSAALGRRGGILSFAVDHLPFHSS